MKEKIIYIASTLGLLVVAFIVVMALVATAHDGFTTLANKETFISAFAGAFFTFILIKFAELGARLRQIERANLESLVAFNHMLMHHMNQLSNADFVAKDIVATYSKASQAKVDIAAHMLPAPAAINLNFFKPIPYEVQHLLRLKNTKFLNELYDYFADLEKLNDSMASLQRFLDLLTEGIVSRKLTQADYINNASIISSKAEELRGFIKAAIKKAQKHAATNRLLLRHRSFWLRLALPIHTVDKYPKAVEAGFAEELKTVKSEMDTSAAASRKEIQEVLKSMADEQT